MVRADRLRDMMAEKGLSQSELARRIGVTQSAIQKLTAGQASGTKYLPQIATELVTSTAYLQGRTDNPDPAEGNVLTDEERAMLRVTAGATPEQFVAISRFMQGRVEAIDASAAAAQQLDAVLLPEIEVSYSMGAGAVIEDYPVTQLVPFSRDWLSTLTRSPAESLFVARGEGDSMMPTILDQDIVIIDRSERAFRGQDRIWAVAYGGFGMIKRLRMLPSGALQINSDNPSVTPIEAVDDEAFIIGRVVAVVRKM